MDGVSGARRVEEQPDMVAIRMSSGKWTTIGYVRYLYHGRDERDSLLKPCCPIHVTEEKRVKHNCIPTYNIQQLIYFHLLTFIYKYGGWKCALSCVLIGQTNHVFSPFFDVFHKYLVSCLSFSAYSGSVSIHQLDHYMSFFSFHIQSPSLSAFTRPSHYV